MNCLYCHKEVLLEVSWTSLFSKSKPAFLCSECENQFQVISGDICKTCNRPLQNLESGYIKNSQCYDCIRWEEDEEWSGYLDRNYSIYEYNEFLKEFIARYKYRGDYVLAKVFSVRLKEKLKIINYDIISYIPLSQERLHERGFNQSEAVIKEARLTPIELLQRTHSEKQSKKSRQERIHLPQVFQVKQDLSLTNKKILLVDDIYTTGSTLRHAAKVLKQSGAISVSSLTIAR